MQTNTNTCSAMLRSKRRILPPCCWVVRETPRQVPGRLLVCLGVRPTIPTSRFGSNTNTQRQQQVNTTGGRIFNNTQTDGTNLFIPKPRIDEHEHEPLSRTTSTAAATAATATATTAIFVIWFLKLLRWQQRRVRSSRSGHWQSQCISVNNAQ